MAKIGYARVSSKEQHLDRQLADLKDVDKLFTDKLSGANTNRPELQKMLAYIREGDIVMVTELDRLGRNNQDLTNSLANKYSIKLLVMALMPPACTSGSGK